MKTACLTNFVVYGQLKLLQVHFLRRIQFYVVKNLLSTTGTSAGNCRVLVDATRSVGSLVSRSEMNWHFDHRDVKLGKLGRDVDDLSFLGHTPVQVFFEVGSDDAGIERMERRAKEGLVKVDRAFNSKVGTTTTIGTLFWLDIGENFHCADKRLRSAPVGDLLRDRSDEDEDTVRSAKLVFRRQDANAPIDHVMLAIRTGVHNRGGRNWVRSFACCRCRLRCCWGCRFHRCC